LTLIILCSRR